MSVRSRLQKLENKMGVGADFERCRQAAEFWASLDDRPWTEEEILAEAEAIQRQGGPMSHEEALEAMQIPREIEELIDAVIRG